jgi:hypothetical protein
MMNSDSDRTPSVVDLGQIAGFRPPVGWLELPPDRSVADGRSYGRDFSPPADPGAVLSIYFRGSLVSPASADCFAVLLAGLPHELAVREIDACAQVLSRMADQDAFEMRSLATADIGGRRVLVVDGEWKTTRKQFHGLMIATDGAGREIQEIFFEAPPDSFTKHINEVVEAIRAVEWKTNSRGAVFPDKLPKCT